MRLVPAAALLGIASIAPEMAMAQSGADDPRPPIAVVDSNGAEIYNGLLRLSIPLLSYGDKARPMEVTLSFASPGTQAVVASSVANDLGLAIQEGLSSHWFVDNIYTGHGTVYRVQVPGGNGEYAALGTGVVQSDGSTYRAYFGQTPATAMTFPDATRNGVYALDGARGVFITGTNIFDRFEFSDGEIWKLYYSTGSSRIKFIVSSRGYGIQYSYVTDTSSASTSPNYGSYWAPTRITFYNRSSVYCNEAALVDCASVTALPTAVTFTYDDTTKALIIHQPGDSQGYRITFDGKGVRSTEKVGVSGSQKQYSYTTNDIDGYSYLSQVVDARGTWVYAYTQTSPEEGGSATGMGARDDPDGLHTVASRGDLGVGYPDYQSDQIGRQYGGLTWARGQLSALIRGADGSGFTYEEDARGNITKRKMLPPSGSGQPTLDTQATYAAECLNPKTCNKPLTVADRRGNVTTFTYSADHGGVLTETGPAVGGIQPVNRYSYVQRYAWVKNSSGTYSQEANPIWVLSEVRTCKTTATVSGVCAGGTTDEVVTAYDYGPTTGPNTLLLRGVTVTADGQTLRTCYGYDAAGNKIYETAPRAGLTSCY